MKNLDTSNNSINLIAGSGNFAYEAALFLLKKKKLNEIILIDENKKITKFFKNKFQKFDIRNIEKIISFIKNSKSNNTVIIGYVNIPKIKEIKFNLKSKLFFTKDFFLNNINDQSLILKKFIIHKKINLLSQKKVFKELLINKENQIINNNHEKIIKNILSKKKIYKKMFKLNLFQSFIQDGNRILSFEDIYGTDNLIKRIGKNDKKFNNLFFFKSKKSNQIDEIDFPIIGLDTIRLLIKYKFKLICLFENEILVSRKKEFLETIKNSGLSLIVL